MHFGCFILLWGCTENLESSIISPDTSFLCPKSMEEELEVGPVTMKYVTWNDTNFSEPVEYTRSHEPGNFPVGVTWVNYTFVDMNDNTVSCTFSITVVQGKG